MRHARLCFSALALFAATSAATWVTPAWAQTEPPDPPPPGATPPVAPAAPPADPAAPTTPAEPPTDPTDPTAATTRPPTEDTEADLKTGSGDLVVEGHSGGIKELEDQSYWFLGLRFRNHIVPKFMINIFVDGGATVNTFAFGPELTFRRGPIELDMSLMYADYSMDPFMFKEKGEPTRALEKASSDMKLLVASIDIMANVPIDKAGRFYFLIGGDVGIAGVLGNLYRSQAYPANADPNSPEQFDDSEVDPDDADAWLECRGAGQPAVIDGEANNYCDASNDHYAGYSEPSLANGGSLPFLVPYIALPHIAFRAKPFADTQLRLDAGFSVTGFFFGLGAGYRLPI